MLERLTKIAQRTKPCSACGYHGPPDCKCSCQTCGGTGKVPEFSLLREPCPYCRGLDWKPILMKVPEFHCLMCQEAGWAVTLNELAKRLLQTLLQLGCLIQFEGTGLIVEQRTALDHHIVEVEVDLAEPEGALLSALELLL